MSQPSRDPALLIDAAMRAKGLGAATSAPPNAQPSVDPTAQAAQTAEMKAVSGGQQRADADRAVDKAAAARAEADGEEGVPAIFKLKRKVGDQDQEVELTESQILGTMDRYRDLNFKHSRMKPVMALAEQILEQVGGDDPEAPAKLAATMAQALKAIAGQKPGQDKKDGQKTAPQPDDFDWSKWERDNAIELPPFMKQQTAIIKEQNGQIQRLGAAIGQLTQMMQAGIETGAIASKQTLGAVEQVAGGLADRRKQLIGEQIGLNINKSQTKYDLPDEKAQEFIQFAAMRGYGIDDFIDPDLADQVVGDYSRFLAAPEYDRMRKQMERRSAAMGSVGAAPTGGGAGESAPQGNGFIDRMVSKRMGG